MADAMDSDTCVGFKRTIEETQALPQSPDSPSAISDCHSPEVVSPLKHASDFVDNSSDSVKNVKLLPEEIQEMPNSVNEKSESCDSVSGFLGSGGVAQDLMENSEVGFVSDGEFMKTDENLHDKKERVASDLAIGEVGLVSDGELVKTGDCLDDEKERVAPDLAAIGEVGLAGQEKLVQESNSANESECSEGLDAGLLTSGESKELFHGKEAESESCLELKKKQLLEEVESILVPAKKTHLKSGTDGPVSTFKFEVIDDTALIETVTVAKSGAKCAAQRKGNKNARQEMNWKKERISGRKEKERSHVVKPPSLGFKNGEKGMKMVYSRMELEAMRFVNVAEQNNLWRDIYRGLGPVVTKEYDNMACAKHEKNISNNYGPRKRFEKMEVVPALRGEAFSENEDIELENLVNNGTQDASSLDPFCRYSANDENEGSEDDDSDEDYASIQRPAFAVEGEPNFDSGSPEDGLEYLRRVRWEAAKIPKVRVAKVDRSKFNREQSAYMPKIPEIAKCPEQLLPLKLWEDAFLADFSELRLAVSRFEGSTASPSQDPHQKPEHIFFETFANVKSKEIDWPHGGSILGSSIDKLSLSTPAGSNVSLLAESISPTSTSTVSESSNDYPLMSVILRMDSVARVSMLRKRIKAVEDMSTLSRRECLWLFALCAVVDTPLDADASASLRSLLRKCAALRATKSILDDEVVMLNILATISGRYFGQSEN